MSWSTVHAAAGRTQIGVQSALGTVTSNWRDLVLRGPANPLGALARKMLPRKDERRYQHDAQTPVKGLQAGASVEMMVDGKRVSTRLASGASPVAFDSASALSHQVLLRAGIGGELTPAAGSTAAGTPSAASCAVASGHGSRFVAGQIAIFNGTPRRVLSVSTDTLGLFPDLALGAIPSSGDAVLNCYNYHLGLAGDSTVYSVRHAWTESGSAETQRQGLGLHAGLSLTLTVGELVGYKLAGQVLSFTDPGDLSMSLATTADDMGAPLVWNPTCYLGSGTSAPSDAQLSTIEVTIPRKWQTVQGSGGTQGVVAVKDVASHDTPCLVKISGHAGAAQWTAWAAQTERYLLAYTQDGSGTDQRTLGVYFGRLVFEGEPQVTINGDLVFFEATLRALMPTDITSTPTPGSTAQIAVSPMIVFLG